MKKAPILEPRSNSGSGNRNHLNQRVNQFDPPHRGSLPSGGGDDAPGDTTRFSAGNRPCRTATPAHPNRTVARPGVPLLQQLRVSLYQRLPHSRYQTPGASRSLPRSAVSSTTPLHSGSFPIP